MSAHYNESLSTAPIVPVLTEKVADVPNPGYLTSLRQEIDTLHRRQQDDFEAFRAEMAAEFASIQAVTPAGLHEDDLVTTTEQLESSARLTSRRTLLKWGGVGAAAALAAAGGATLTMPTAHAADNANLVLGSATNTVEHLTVLSYDGSETAPTVFKVTTSVANSLGVYGTAGNWNSAISAGVGGIAGAGASAIGVNAKAGTSGTGARGVAKGFGAYGVWGINDAGVGVQGDSNTGVDLAATGLGRVYQFPQVFDGPPTTGSYLVGEQIRDINGNLLICVASGTPGTWRKVAAVAPGAGGIVYLLSAPIRLLDTRNGIGMFPAGSTNILQVTGVDIGGISVPKGATGVVGNVTVVSPTAGGDLRLYPGGATAPNTSSINFATGQVIANGVTVGLNVTGQISIKVDLPAGKATHVIFDASGYVM